MATENISLHTLPVEIIYVIMDKMDESNILLSLRNVCERLNSVIDSYKRYETFNTLEISYDRYSDEQLENLGIAIMTNKVR